MQIQMSYEESEHGSLYIVPTPIGNLDDMTFRAIKILKQVHLIAAEDTRHTQKLLNHFDIKNNVISYHEHNKESRMNPLLERLENGEDIALVSDAGMPAISDPGYDLVKEVIARNLNVVVLPGANAAICALVGSGLSTKEFLFYGFLPRKKKEKVAELERLKNLQATLIFYESPYRVKDTIGLLEKHFDNRQIVIAREISKMFEQYIRGSVEEVLQWVEQNEVKGECCILVEGSIIAEEVGQTWWETLTILEHVVHYEQNSQFTNKQAIKQVALDRNISKRDVYQEVHVKNPKK